MHVCFRHEIYSMRWREVPEKIGEKEGRVGTADASSPAFDAARGRTHGTWSQGMCVGAA